MKTINNSEIDGLNAADQITHERANFDRYIRVVIRIHERTRRQRNIDAPLDEAVSPSYDPDVDAKSVSGRRLSY